MPRLLKTVAVTLPLTVVVICEIAAGAAKVPLVTAPVAVPERITWVPLTAVT